MSAIGGPRYGALYRQEELVEEAPAGVATWSDKLLQEVIRSLLEAYYEPQFSGHSDGFRPGRGCHTALEEIQRQWRGTVWLIEGDVTDCFGSLDHSIMRAMLAEKIYEAGSCA